MVYRFLLSLCGDPELAEELTSETFYRAFLHIGRFRGDCKPETWLCQIAKNALRKEHRRRKQHIPLESAAPLVDCGKKIKRRRIRRVLIAIPLGLLAAFVLVVLALTFWSGHLELNPIVHEKEAGTWNLTAGELTTTIGEVDEYVFYTNYEQIQVFSETEDITVMLWNTEYPDDYILISNGDKDPRCHTFGNLTSSFLYRITCDGPEDTVITVSEGRRAHFLQNLTAVLEALLFR